MATTLAAAVEQFNVFDTNKPKVIQLRKTPKQLTLSASIEKDYAVSENYFYVRVPTSTLPLLSPGPANDKGQIVIDINASKICRTKSGFAPKVVVLNGLDTLKSLKANNELFCNVWMGSKAIKKLSIMADDAIGTNELTNKLNRLITQKYTSKVKGGDCNPCGSYAWIIEVYPFENYLIYGKDGDNFKQYFKLDPVTRDVSLVGESVQVFTEYSTVPKGMQSAAEYDPNYLNRTLTQEMMFDVPNCSPAPLGSFANYSGAPVIPDSISYPSRSEVANPGIKTMLNVSEALAMYLATLKNGTHKPSIPAFSPVPAALINAAKEADVACKIAQVNVGVHDFIMWQHKTLNARGTKTKDGLVASHYAYVGDANDTSTWLLPVNNKTNIQESLKNVDVVNGIPKSMRASIKSTLKKKVAAANQMPENDEAEEPVAPISSKKTKK